MGLRVLKSQFSLVTGEGAEDSAAKEDFCMYGTSPLSLLSFHTRGEAVKKKPEIYVSKHSDCP